MFDTLNFLIKLKIQAVQGLEVNQLKWKLKTNF